MKQLKEEQGIWSRLMLDWCLLVVVDIEQLPEKAVIGCFCLADAFSFIPGSLIEFKQKRQQQMFD